MTSDKTPVMRLFCRKLEPCFSRFPGGKKNPFLRAVCEELKGFDEAILAEAASRILRSTKSTTWPNVGTLYQACSEVRSEHERKLTFAEDTERARQGDGTGRSLPDRVALEIMVRADFGLCRGAIEAGYHPLILDFVKSHRDMPTIDDCDLLQELSTDRLRDARTKYEANPSAINAFYLKGLLGRRETLARLILETHADLEKRSQINAQATAG
ncbi:MAG: hypothetical protein ABJJ37_27120 [Roseibium sp.]